MSVRRFFAKRPPNKEETLEELSKIKRLLQENLEVNKAHGIAKQDTPQDVSRLGQTVNKNWRRIEKLINAFKPKHLPNFQSSGRSISQTERVQEMEDQINSDSSNRSPESFQSKPTNASYLCNMRQMLEDPQFHTTSTDIQQMRAMLNGR